MALLLFATTLSVVPTRKGGLLTRLQHWKESYLYLGVGLALFLIFVVPNVFGFSPWFDETTQFFLSVSPADTYGVVEFAAIQQQPPIDYYFSQVARIFFGENLFSMRVHVLIFCLCFSFKTALFASREKKNIFLYVIWLSFFLTYSLHAQYFVEARPLALGILLSFLCFLEMTKSKNDSQKISIPLLSWSTLLLMTLGYQSCLFLIAMYLTCLVRDRGHHWLSNFISALLIPGILCLPIWAYIYVQSVPLDQFRIGNRSGWGILQEHFTVLVRAGIFHYSGASALAVVLASLLQKNSLSQSLKRSIPLLVYVSVFSVLVALSWTFINWGLYSKYFVLLFSGLFFLVLAEIPSESFINQKGVLIRKIGFFLFLLLSVVGFWPFFQKNSFDMRHQFLFRPQWNSIFEHLRAANENEMLFSFVEVGQLSAGNYHELVGRLYQMPEKKWISSRVFLEKSDDIERGHAETPIYIYLYLSGANNSLPKLLFQYFKNEKQGLRLQFIDRNILMVRFSSGSEAIRFYKYLLDLETNV